MRRTGNLIAACFILVLVNGFPADSSHADESLAKQSQNPLGTIISSPFENNFYSGIGPSESTAYALPWKPVYPVDLGKWNLINRFIIPAVYGKGQDEASLLDASIDVGNTSLTELVKGSAFGLTDINYTAYLSPKKSGPWIWGIDGALTLPTATEDRYASDKWSAGPAFVALTMPGSWVTGFLVQNVWSFTGDDDAPDVNKFLFQYFINYNFDDGWYLNSSPILTSNWEADSGNQWTVPLGAGVGRLVKHGNLPVDYRLGAYWNAEKPEFAPDWSLQFVVKFLFPK